jgi:hypothetical protein
MEVGGQLLMQLMNMQQIGRRKNFRLEDLIYKEATVLLVKMRNGNVYY